MYSDMCKTGKLVIHNIASDLAFITPPKEQFRKHNWEWSLLEGGTQILKFGRGRGHTDFANFPLGIQISSNNNY